MADGGGRLLRQRSGHSEPPIKLRFHGNNGQQLLSAGKLLSLFCSELLELSPAINSLIVLTNAINYFN